MLLKNRHIFLVEDNQRNSAILRMLLEQHGARTEMDRWGMDTVRRVRHFMPVDIILMDLMLTPKITGYDVFDLLQAEADLRHIPVVAVSAADPGEALIRTKAHGFSGFFAKPINVDTFPEHIARIIEGEKVFVLSY